MFNGEKSRLKKMVQIYHFKDQLSTHFSLNLSVCHHLQSIFHCNGVNYGSLS